MSYQGNKPPTSFESPKKDRFTGITGTTCSLTYAVSSVADILVWVNSVKQDFTNYSVSGSTLTLSGTLVSSDIVEVTYVGRTYGSTAPTDASVGTSALQDDAVTAAKLSSTAVDNTNTNSTLITAQTEKTTLVDADKFLISDSAASGALKYVQKSNLPSGGFVRVGGGESGGSAVSVSSVSFNNVFTTTYDTYFITLFSQCATNNSNTYLRLRASGTDITASNYMWVSGANASVSGTSASSGQTGNTAATNFQLGQWGGNTAYGNYHTFYIYNPLPQSTDTGHGDFPYIVGHKSSYTSDNYQTYQTFSGILAQGTGGDGLTFYEGEGNVVRYTINIYGMVQS